MVYKRSMFQKAVSLLLTVSLLIPGMGVGARAEAPVEKPQLRVVGTLTDGGKYLELGLSVDSKSGLFQSAGVLLKYDATKLTPLKWGTIEDTDEALAAAKITVPTATAVKTAWNEAPILPTKSKGADDMVGKTAKAVKLPGMAADAYLYLSAEAAKGQKLPQKLPVETGTAPEGLPAKTASEKPIAAIGAAEAPADQVVTVRFQVGTTTDSGPDPVERNYTLAELVTAIDLVTYDSTEATPNDDELALLQGSPLAIPGGTPTKLEGSSYIADNADYTTAGFTSAADVSFHWIAAGQTVDSGGSGSADVSKIRTVTFYDWDGTTKLGVVAVQAGDILGEDAYKTFLSGKYDTSVMELDKVADDPYALTPIATEGYVFNPDRETKPLLTDKGGYTFIGWVPSDAEFSHYPKADEAAAQKAVFNWDLQKTQEDAALGADDPYPDLTVGDYVNPIVENIDVKACYLANSKCGLDSVTAQRYYTLEYGDIERSGANYSIEVVVKRYCIADVGVFSARMYEPVLKLALTPDGSTGSINLSVPLENKDVTKTKITIPSIINRGQLNAADIYGKNGSAVTATGYSRIIDLSNADNASRQNYIKFGTVNLMNESARTTAKTVADRITGFTSAAYFTTDLGIASSGSAVQKSGLLLKAWRAANEWTAASGPHGDGILDPDQCVKLTYAQTEAVLLNQKNVYLKNVSFVDTDARAEYIGGDFSWQEVAVNTASWPTVNTETNISGYKIYWSRDGITKRAEVVGVIQNANNYSVPAGTSKQYYDRYLLVCAVDSNGNELPASAAIPVFELAQD